MDKRHVIYAGSALLVLGLFCPAVSLPVSVSLIGVSQTAALLVALAAACVILTRYGRDRDVLYPAAASVGLLLYALLRAQMVVGDMQTAMASLGPLGRSAAAPIQLQWGWLVLGAGGAALLYAGVMIRRQADGLGFKPEDDTARILLALSVVLMAASPGVDLFVKLTARTTPTAPPTDSSTPPATTGTTASTTAGKEEQDYIRTSLQLYDLSAAYHDSLLDGRIPGVDFKIKNNGPRTLSEIDVRVVFYDENDKPISEETYYPVLDSDFSDSKPLKPNYIWQQESGKFYSAKNVPSEWKAGKVTATITEIKFAPGE